jgi:hypothetical protein
MSKLTKILGTAGLIAGITLSPLEVKAGTLPEIRVDMGNGSTFSSYTDENGRKIKQAVGVGDIATCTIISVDGNKTYKSDSPNNGLYTTKIKGCEEAERIFQKYTSTK